MSNDMGKKCAICGHEWSDGDTASHACIIMMQKRVMRAVVCAVSYGQIDGGHHKDWVIDQMIRALTGSGYAEVITDACAGEDGPDTYSWDCGVAP